MGKLIRAFDWENSALGAPETWPRSLCASLSIVLNSRFPMFIWWGEDLIQFYNDAYRPSLGNKGKHPTALGQRGEDCWTEIWPTIKPLIDKAMRQGEATWHENQYIPIYRNGRLEDVYWTFSYSPIMDESAIPAGVLVTCTETTETIFARKKIEQSESNLRSMIINAPVAMCILTGPSFIVELANKRMYELWGRTENELINKPIFEGLPEAGKQGLQQVMRNVYTTGETFSANELPVTLPRNGKPAITYLNFIYAAFRNGEGSITGVTAVATDVTEHVVARMKLEQTNEEFKFVTDFMPQMIWVTKPDGYHEFYNKRWYDYTGLSYEQTKDTGWNNVVHPDEQERSRQIWQQSLNTSEPYEIEYRLRRHDGVYRWFLGRALPLKDPAGVVLKWFGTCTDIDDQKRTTDLMEEMVKERTKDLREANARLIRLNANLQEITHVSHHDLQEPLRKIMIFSEIVMKENADNLNDGSVNHLNKVITAARRMSTALRDVLDFAALNKKHPFVDVDLNQVLSLVLTDLELLISEKAAKIISERLPVIQGVPAQMHQLFYNLLNNGLKFSRRECTPVINITCEKVTIRQQLESTERIAHKKFYEIKVKDNGIGFDPEAADKIFGMFQRLHSKEEFYGTGIGLALCKKVVANHGGSITAESKPGEGATFKIHLHC